MNPYVYIDIYIFFEYMSIHSYFCSKKCFLFLVLWIAMPCWPSYLMMNLPAEHGRGNGLRPVRLRASPRGTGLGQGMVRPPPLQTQ